MVVKKGVIILVVVALVLAITAITLRVVDSSEVPTSTEGSVENAGSGEVGVTIIQSGVEDKLADEASGGSE